MNANKPDAVKGDFGAALLACFVLCVILFCGYWVGFGQAHAEIARECERLGAFYVGYETYRCELKTIEPEVPK